MKRATILIAVFVLTACSDAFVPPKVRIAINPWPGYEFLYLAAQKKYFAEVGLDVELVEMSSLSDVQRLYIQGRVDGMASTMIEAVQAAGITQVPLSIVLVPDYSDGGDVIVAKSELTFLSDLKGKRIAGEIGSLGMFILVRALERIDLTLDDVDFTHVEQLNMLEKIKNGTIDAAVTYPPYSTEILRNHEFKELFSTSEIPLEVIDVVSVRLDMIDSDPEWVAKFHQAWQMALDYAQRNRAEAYKIMADREGITVGEFTEALNGVAINSSESQPEILKSTVLKHNISNVCRVLSESKTVSFKCADAVPLITPYKQE
ncbi:ABC transporter substrate-binding protein [Vibrio sp. Of7-15]|uniref:ABC transporter substrate-binding protein n=1 Tax=Vibrio sp. Of7-15 TaxID=2724879 RepID=UPI001EF37878|nr:ABC transporter substrate-binding protein [Vibrio sp. Of7-15]MCG7495703.1 ABC transporter substrate-binding protein [Vibrio sp. Of7-15]